MRPQLSVVFSPPAQRPPVPIVIFGGGLDFCRVRVDLTAELTIRHASASDGVEASLEGDVVAEALDSGRRSAHDPMPAGWSPARITANRNSNLALGQANPFVWIQLMDQVGRPFTDQVFLGPGVDTCYSLHSQFESEAVRHRSIARGAPIAGRSHAPHVAMLAIELRRGLYARLLMRTYASLKGPRFQAEALVLELIAPLEPAALNHARAGGFPRLFRG